MEHSLKSSGVAFWHLYTFVNKYKTSHNFCLAMVHVKTLIPGLGYLILAASGTEGKGTVLISEGLFLFVILIAF